MAKAIAPVFATTRPKLLATLTKELTIAMVGGGTIYSITEKVIIINKAKNEHTRELCDESLNHRSNRENIQQGTKGATLMATLLRGELKVITVKNLSMARVEREEIG